MISGPSRQHRPPFTRCHVAHLRAGVMDAGYNNVVARITPDKNSYISADTGEPETDFEPESYLAPASNAKGYNTILPDADQFLQQDLDTFWPVNTEGAGTAQRVFNAFYAPQGVNPIKLTNGGHVQRTVTIEPDTYYVLRFAYCSYPKSPDLRRTGRGGLVKIFYEDEEEMEEELFNSSERGEYAQYLVDEALTTGQVAMESWVFKTQDDEEAPTVDVTLRIEAFEDVPSTNVTEISTTTNKVKIVGHGFETGQTLLFASTDDMPQIDDVAMSPIPRYYVVKDDADYFWIALSQEDALADPPVTVNFTDPGTGTISVSETNILYIYLCDLAKTVNQSNADLEEPWDAFDPEDETPGDGWELTGEFVPPAGPEDPGPPTHGVVKFEGRDGVYPHGGERCAEVLADTVITTSSYVAVTADLMPGQLYEVSFWLRDMNPEAGSERIEAYLLPANDEDATGSMRIGYGQGIGQWIRICYQVYATGGNNGKVALLWIPSAPIGSPRKRAIDLLLDDVAIVPIAMTGNGGGIGAQFHGT